MTTRRRFIAANLIGAAGGALLPELLAAEIAQSNPPPAGPAGASAHSARDFWNDWPRYLTAKVNAARDRRLSLLAAIDSPAKAGKRSEMVRATLWELLGGPLERSPLNAHITHSRERSDFRIDALLFESIPGVLVSANLYVPATGKAPYPAILCPVGHSDNGKAYASYQHYFQNLARQGYIVLAWDPWGQGERLQYIDPKTGASRFGPTGEHSQAGRPMILLGCGIASYMAWDGVRALDYLLTRPDVDPNRIGCSGHSGGGTMTMFLAALEPRIHAAVSIEGNFEDLAGPSFDPPGSIDDAEQNVVASLPVTLDRGDLLATFAPKPLLMCNTAHDAGETYSPVLLEAVDDVYAELKRIYAIFGKTDRLSLFTSHLPHDLDYFNRQAAYQWFNRWLKGETGETEEPDFHAFPDAELNATETGQVISTPGCRFVVQVNSDRLRQTLSQISSNANPSGDTPSLNELRADLAKLLVLPSAKSPLDAKVVFSGLRKGISIEEIQFQSEPGVRIPGWFAKKSGSAARRPVVLYIADDGGEDIVNEPGSMDRLLAEGHPVCAITLRGLGISAPRFPASAPNYLNGADRMEDGFPWVSLVLGQPAIGQRVWDIVRAVDYLAIRPDVDPSQIRILGRGGAGIAAQMAALLVDRVRAVLLDRVLVSYASVVKSTDYSVQLAWFVPGILRRFDLPDLCAAMSPRPCWILNGTDPSGNAMTEAAIREEYGKRASNGSAVARPLRFVVDAKADPQGTYLEWIASS